MINTKSNVNVKIDANVKKHATEILGSMGIDQTTAIDMFYRQIIIEQRLPFQPTAASTLDKQIIAAILKNNPKRIELEADANGNVIIDKEQYPEIYNWAVKG
jgi:DNA-damage-inducible protein J